MDIAADRLRCGEGPKARGPRDRTISAYLSLSNSGVAMPMQSARDAEVSKYEVRAMTELNTQDRAPKPKRDKVRMVADDVVTANSLATHLSA
jgi:hypothetical protein